MEKYVEGSYPTVKDAMMAVERLGKEGYGKDEIFLVANDRIRPQLSASSTIQTAGEDIIDSQTEMNDRSFWDRVREAFTVDNYDPDVYTREGSAGETNLLFDYQDEIRKGNIVVLLQKKESIEKSETSNRRSSGEPSTGSAAGKTPSDYVGVDSQTPRTINSEGGIPLGSNSETVEDPEKSLDVDVEGMEREHERQRQWSEESLRDEDDLDHDRGGHGGPG